MTPEPETFLRREVLDKTRLTVSQLAYALDKLGGKNGILLTQDNAGRYQWTEAQIAKIQRCREDMQKAQEARANSGRYRRAGITVDRCRHCGAHKDAKHRLNGRPVTLAPFALDDNPANITRRNLFFLCQVCTADFEAMIAHRSNERNPIQ